MIFQTRQPGGGRLHAPEVLLGQLDRLVADKKIDRFLEAFPRQWLQLHRVGMFSPAPKLYPDYDPWLERSMLRETTGFFAKVFRKNLPIRAFLASDWTILNPRLAEHYGVPTPPPNVEPLEPTPKDAFKMTVRMQLADHATKAACASCHRKIDPLGLAFDNYDAIGRWRTTERVTAGTGDDPPVDASGVLPDGRTFAGPEEFKQLLLADEDGFARAFVEQMATFALRRVMTVDDAATLDTIVSAAKPDGYRLQSLVRGLVLSDMFVRE